MADLKIGDQVQLISGGAVMTIEDIDSHHPDKPYASCVWFDGKKLYQEKIFIAALKKYEEPNDGGVFFGSI